MMYLCLLFFMLEMLVSSSCKVSSCFCEVCVKWVFLVLRFIF